VLVWRGSQIKIVLPCIWKTHSGPP
jgi:hypothetical protein